MIALTPIKDRQFYAIRVPDDAEYFFFAKDASQVYYWSEQRGKSYTVDLPPAKYRYVCTLKCSGEKQAQAIVQQVANASDRYINYDGDYPIWFHSAQESLRSLVAASGGDPLKNYAIIEVEKVNVHVVADLLQ